MSELSEILAYNQHFVETGEYEKYFTNKYPGRELAILSCMDARIIELLPNALGLKNGDAKLIKNAGALVTHPWGSVMRSLLVAVFELKVKEIMVIAHHDCGMRGLHAEEFLQRIPQSWWAMTMISLTLSSNTATNKLRITEPQGWVTSAPAF